MNKKIILISLGICFTVIAGILAFWYYAFSNFGAGTHGSVEAYSFPVSKYELEEIINTIIKDNKKIQRDTNKIDSYYNQGGYVTLYIYEKGNAHKYTFRYFGGEEYWNEHLTTSELFICYLYNDQGKAISERNDNINDHLEFVHSELELFESELVNKITEEINAHYAELDYDRIDSLKYR